MRGPAVAASSGLTCDHPSRDWRRFPMLPENTIQVRRFRVHQHLAGRNPGKLDGVGKKQPTQETSGMNTDQLKGNWKQFVGKAKEKWGRLTDDDWKVVEGKRDQLAGRIQERYGVAREEAERQVEDLEKASRNT
jgi:uncharacterized protein YjbJ (UPF0337 family)